MDLTLMTSKQQKELTFAQNVLRWDQEYINQDENRTWILMAERYEFIEELYYEAQTQIYHFFGWKLINEKPVGYQRWFNEQEQEIFDPTIGHIILLEEPEELLFSLLESEGLPIDEESPVEALEWILSPYASGKQWLQRLKSGFYFALRLDECNLVHYEVTLHPTELARLQAQKQKELRKKRARAKKRKEKKEEQKKDFL